MLLKYFISNLCKFTEAVFVILNIKVHRSYATSLLKNTILIFCYRKKFIVLHNFIYTTLKLYIFHFPR